MNEDRNKDGEKMERSLYQNNFFNVILGIFIGLAIAFVISNFTHKPSDAIPTLIYTPNAMAERKPIYMQVLKTQEEVDAVRATKIYFSDQATIGAGIRVGSTGLEIYLKKELELPDVHVRDIGPQVKNKVVVGDYTYIPNAIVTADPSPVQMLDTPEDVIMARKMKDLLYPRDLRLGSAISCKPTFPCYVISKKEIEDRLVIKRFESSKPKNFILSRRKKNPTTS